MNNTLVRNAVVTIASFVFVISVVSAWTAPGATAPGGNVSAPITVGPTWQIRQGDLTLASTTVSGVLNSTGGMIGTNIVAEKISLTSQMRIGNSVLPCNATNAGAMRWTGSAFEGCNGTVWGPLAVGGGTPPPATCPAPGSVAELMRYLTGATAFITRFQGNESVINGVAGVTITMTSDGWASYNGYKYFQVVPAGSGMNASNEPITFYGDTFGIHVSNGDFHPWTSVPKQTTWCQ